MKTTIIQTILICFFAFPCQSQAPAKMLFPFSNYIPGNSLFLDDQLIMGNNDFCKGAAIFSINGENEFKILQTPTAYGQVLDMVHIPDTREFVAVSTYYEHDDVFVIETDKIVVSKIHLDGSLILSQDFNFMDFFSDEPDQIVYIGSENLGAFSVSEGGSYTLLAINLHQGGSKIFLFDENFQFMDIQDLEFHVLAATHLEHDLFLLSNGQSILPLSLDGIGDPIVEDAGYEINLLHKYRDHFIGVSLSRGAVLFFDLNGEKLGEYVLTDDRLFHFVNFSEGNIIAGVIEKQGSSDWMMQLSMNYPNDNHVDLTAYKFKADVPYHAHFSNGIWAYHGIIRGHPFFQISNTLDPWFSEDYSIMVTDITAEEPLKFYLDTSFTLIDVYNLQSTHESISFELTRSASGVEMNNITFQNPSIISLNCAHRGPSRLTIPTPEFQSSDKILVQPDSLLLVYPFYISQVPSDIEICFQVLAIDGYLNSALLGQNFEMCKRIPVELVTSTITYPVQEAIAIYPNPVTDQLNLVLPEKDHFNNTIEVFDMRGKRIIFRKNDYSPISTIGLNSGIYILKITGSGGAQHITFVKH